MVGSTPARPLRRGQVSRHLAGRVGGRTRCGHRLGLASEGIGDPREVLARAAAAPVSAQKSPGSETVLLAPKLERFLPTFQEVLYQVLHLRHVDRAAEFIWYGGVFACFIH